MLMNLAFLVPALAVLQAPAAAATPTATANAHYEWRDGVLWTYKFDLSGLAAADEATVEFSLPAGWKVSVTPPGLNITPSDAASGAVSYSVKVRGAQTLAFEARPGEAYANSDSVPWKASLGKDVFGEGELPGAMALSKPVETKPPKATLSWSAKEDSGQTEWTYTAKFENVTKNKDGKAELSASLTLPAGLTVVSAAGVSSEVAGTLGGLATYKFLRTADADPWELVFKVRSDPKFATSGRVSWTASVGGVDAGKGTSPGPAALTIADLKNLTVPPKKEPEKTSSLWRFIFGAGAAYAFDDEASFEVKDDFLFLRNDSKWRTTAIIGAAFRTRRPANPRAFKRILPNELAVAIDFAPNTSKDVDGVTLGAVWNVQPYLGLMVGLRLRRGEELSDGFQRSAALYVAAQTDRTDPAQKALHDRFTLNEDQSNLASLRHFDGFPLKDNKGSLIFPGSPLSDSHNSSFIFAVVVPLQFSFTAK